MSKTKKNTVFQFEKGLEELEKIVLTEKLSSTDRNALLVAKNQVIENLKAKPAGAPAAPRPASAASATPRPAASARPAAARAEPAPRTRPVPCDCAAVGRAPRRRRCRRVPQCAQSRTASWTDAAGTITSASSIFSLISVIFV